MKQTDRHQQKPMAKDSPSQAADKYILRLPDGMRDLIADRAKKSNRSMNAEIVARLQESFGGTLGAAPTEELLKELSRRFGGLQIKIEAPDGGL